MKKCCTVQLIYGVLNEKLQGETERRVVKSSKWQKKMCLLGKNSS